MISMGPVTEIQPRHIHPTPHQLLNPSQGTHRRTQRAHNLRSTPQGVRTVVSRLSGQGHRFGRGDDPPLAERLGTDIGNCLGHQ